MYLIYYKGWPLVPETDTCSGEAGTKVARFTSMVVFIFLSISSSVAKADLLPCIPLLQVIQGDCMGTTEYAGGGTYSGQMRKGKPHGEGEILQPNGDKYRLTFVDGQPGAKGRVFYANGDRYEGELSPALYRHGIGTLILANGEKYTGQFIYGKKSGYGEQEWPDNERYKGHFRANDQHGEGVYFFKNGDVINGLYVNGKAHGRGVLTKANGEVFVGYWENDRLVNKFITLEEDEKETKRKEQIAIEEKRKEETERREREERALQARIKEENERRQREAAERQRILVEGDGSPDDQACKSYGFKPNTPYYFECRQRIDLARAEADMQRKIYDEQVRQYEDRKRIYDQQVAEYEEAKRKERARKQLEMGLRMLSGQSVRDAAMATSGMAPIPPGAPPIRNTNQSFNVIMPNGNMIRCRDTGTAFFCNN